MKRNRLSVPKSLAATLTIVILAGLAGAPETLAQGSVTGRITNDKAELLSDVVVQVKVALGRAIMAETGSPDPVMDLAGGAIQPRVACVKNGQPMGFKNSDGILHVLRVLSKENPARKIELPADGKKVEVKFSKAEAPFRVKCDVHPRETAYVAVMTHPYFAVTGNDGTFKIDNVPDGAYEIEAWHPQLGMKTAKVTIKGESTSVDFGFGE